MATKSNLAAALVSDLPKMGQDLSLTALTFQTVQELPARAEKAEKAAKEETDYSSTSPQEESEMMRDSLSAELS